MKLLLATDGSIDANVALATACRLFRGRTPKVDLLCVVPELPREVQKALSGWTEGASYPERIMDEAERILAAGVAKLRAGGLDAHSRVETGSPGHTIVGLGADYDITVVGSYGTPGPTAAGLGPVATQVVSHSPRTVLVARELPPDGPLRILLCVDRSMGSERAVENLLSSVRIEQAEVDVIHVIEIPWIRLGIEWDDSDESGADYPQAREPLRQDADRFLESVRDRLAGCGIATTPIVTEGLPEAQILGQAEIGQYDLIVLGANGATEPGHAMLGSVSIRVVQGAASPVMVAR